jgi:sensor histidine kinase YesM
LEPKTKSTTWNAYLLWITFWLVSFFILFKVFTIDYDGDWLDFIYTFLFHLPLIVVMTFNTFCINRYVSQKKYGHYLVVFVLLIIIGLWGFKIVFGPINDWVFPEYYLSLFYNQVELVQFIVGYLILGFLITTTRNWFRLRKHQLALEKENHQVKLQHLKTQLNPHFLFNSLNNIYALAEGNQAQSKSYILKLSEALRYMIYETEQEKVLLENEIRYIANYIELEKLRMDNSDSVHFEMKGAPEGYLIAPLILLPIIENCFKHSDPEDPSITISVNVKDDRLELITKNRMKNDKPASNGGVGSKNIADRLMLIYPERHCLFSERKENTYHVSLTIELME